MTKTASILVSTKPSSSLYELKSFSFNTQLIVTGSKGVTLGMNFSKSIQLRRLVFPDGKTTGQV